MWEEIQAESVMRIYLIDSARVREGETTELKPSVLKSQLEP